MKVADFAARKKQADRAAYKNQVLDAWDRLYPKERQAQRVGKESLLDTNADVRRRAKEQL